MIISTAHTLRQKPRKERAKTPHVSGSSKKKKKKKKKPKTPTPHKPFLSCLPRYRRAEGEREIGQRY
jgi:hypothetical protein